LHSDVVDARTVVGPDTDGFVVGPTDGHMVEDHIVDVGVADVEADASGTRTGRMSGSIAHANTDVPKNHVVGIDEDQRVVIHLLAGELDAASRSGLSGDGEVGLADADSRVKIDAARNAENDCAGILACETVASTIGSAIVQVGDFADVAAPAA